MDRYLLYHDRTGRIIELETRTTSSQRFEELRKEFLIAKNSNPNLCYRVSAIRLDQNSSFFVDRARTKQVFYDWGLAGPDGAWYNLIRMPGITMSDIFTARRILRATRDVTYLWTTHIDKLI